ncbi:uncharacterized protein J4E78_004940 [Alternaria triticimaculans]|uniref:uncharacterized protein n=1 Tax=Alternaria triticimaculans TaxID=297637 RepID=UPI0020C2C7ED|nr:uncharacterized protein J4E78_004940 [Alternaria triticimaculans]KAI4660239.1 hypothetical protein J4E78_004940 [Alternaria triticimaculans]
MSFKSTLYAAAAMLAMAPLSANAHMILKSPVPYGNPNNSPLDASGSDFPCKAVPYTVNTMNEWKVGSSQTLAFTGTAVHGGGSCQISVTTDKEPTKDSVWKVIYSIEGGCPVSAEANLDEFGPSLDNTFKFDIPPELPNGVMTTAWTWFNKIGNREMYMNCAPVTISGGADDTTAFDTLPDMAVANIPVPQSCGTTKESSDFTFQNPGKYVKSVGKGPFVDLCTGATSQPSTGGDAGGGGNGNADSGAPVASPPAASPPAASPSPDSGAYQPAATPPSAASPAPVSPPPAPPAAPSGTKSACSPKPKPAESTLRTLVTVTAPMPTNTDGIFPPGPAAGTGTAPAAAPAPQPTGQSPASPVAPLKPTPSGAPASPAPANPGSDKEACSPDGAVICSSDGTKFGLCDHGKVIMIPVADGTKCENGAIAKRGDYSHRNQRTAI